MIIKNISVVVAVPIKGSRIWHVVVLGPSYTWNWSAAEEKSQLVILMISLTLRKIKYRQRVGVAYEWA